MNYNQIAELLDKACLNAEAVPQINLSRKLNLEEAYAIQTILISRRYTRGEKLCGLKLGFTSQAKMQQMGVNDLIWGRLTDAMEVRSGSKLDLDDFIHPRAEPEIVFKFKKEVDRVLSESDLEEYIESVAVAIEIIDSRYLDFKFSLEDVIADNCSSAAFVTGKWHSYPHNLSDLEMALWIDDEKVEKGKSNAILGDPLQSVFAASRLALEYGEIIRPGDILLAGAATPAVYLKKGQTVKVEAEGLGETRISV